mmetsp:Transcript_9244/g.30045  ORF Transcript_9244/g.30045 Transcript_9244/m.30045 type:complete len:200 (-) Transcript_9244:157-756(-)
MRGAKDPRPAGTAVHLGEGLGEVGKGRLVGGDALGDDAGHGHHGEAAVGDFLFGDFRRDLEHEGVKFEVAGSASRVAAGGDGDAGDEFGDAEEEGRGDDGIGVFVEGIPEDVHLGAPLGEGPPGEGAEALREEDARRRHHRNSPVLQLRLAEPVEVDPEVVDLREPQGVEAHVPRHRPVEERGLRQERQRLRHLRAHRH